MPIKCYNVEQLVSSRHEQESTTLRKEAARRERLPCSTKRFSTIWGGLTGRLEPKSLGAVKGGNERITPAGGILR